MFEINIIGDGELKNKLKKLVCDMNLQSNIKFKGFLTDLIKF